MTKLDEICLIEKISDTGKEIIKQLFKDKIAERDTKMYNYYKSVFLDNYEGGYRGDELYSEDLY